MTCCRKRTLGPAISISSFTNVTVPIHGNTVRRYATAHHTPHTTHHTHNTTHHTSHITQHTSHTTSHTTPHTTPHTTHHTPHTTHHTPHTKHQTPHTTHNRRQLQSHRQPTHRKFANCQYGRHWSAQKPRAM